MSGSTRSGIEEALRRIGENKRTRKAHLDLSGLWLRETPAEIGELVWLTSLDLSATGVSYLKPLRGLRSLERLWLKENVLTDLRPIADLKKLVYVSVAFTVVEDLSPASALEALQEIDLTGSRVSDLYPLLGPISRGCQICAEDCPLVTPPPEIVKQGNEAILNYFREKESGGVDHLYEAKMLIVGEGGSGKTSLLRRLYQPGAPLPNESESTKGIAIHRHEFKLSNGRNFKLNVWDFGGQEIYHATHQFFLTRRSLYLLVDDTRKDYRSVSDEGFKYWLDLIEVFGGHSPVLIFQNEKGGRSKAIDLAGIKGRFDNVKDLYAGNLEHFKAADRVRGAIEFFSSNLQHIGDELPAPWVRVRAEIERLGDERPYISQPEYFDVYARHLPFDREKALRLSRYLHDLGVFLHFQDDPLLCRTVILQNQWATEAVFRVFDDEIIKRKFGRFDTTDCNRLWKSSVYADMHPELLALMKNFEFCYELRDSDPPTWLATQLVPPAKPEVLDRWAQTGDLVMRYRYDFLPKGMISRLTVRLNRYVCSPNMAWVSGVLFESDKTVGLVELLAKGNEIELRTRGPEDKALLTVIASELDSLNDSYQGLRGRVDTFIPCNCSKCRTISERHFFARKALLKRKEDKRLKVECPISYEDVRVLELLDGLRVDILPSRMKEEQVHRTVDRVRVFLASSSELREDRDNFDLYFRQQNDELLRRGMYLEVVRWENFLDAMSETRLQDEYNEAIRKCDIFVSLFFTKTGKFTNEEFDVAHHQFKATKKPMIYAFFKNAEIKSGAMNDDDLLSLFAFKQKLKELGHFYTTYDNIQDLKLQFRGQLDRILSR